jgi:hypothetical protein
MVKVGRGWGEREWLFRGEKLIWLLGKIVRTCSLEEFPEKKVHVFRGKGPYVIIVAQFIP